jgi:hypothetical protein
VPMVEKGFEVGHQVRLKTALEPPVNIPAGAPGSVIRVSDWDVWVCFDKGVVRLPMSEVERVVVGLTQRPGRLVCFWMT